MGIGGGTILIPALIIFTSLNQQNVQAINLLYFIPTAIIALAVHIKNKLIDFNVAIRIIIFGIIGSIIGSTIAVNLNSDILRKLFGIFLFGMGVAEIWGYAIKNKLKQFFVDK